MSPAPPLSGKRIVVTRARHQAAPLVAALEARGAEVLLAPAIRIAPPEDIGPLDEALQGLAAFDWLVVTSANAVDAVFDRLEALALTVPETLHVAAVGPKTREALRARGVETDVVPERYRADAVFDALSARGPLEGKRVLLPRADIARDELRQRLESAGAEPFPVVAYRTVSSEGTTEAALARVAEGGVDVVTFTSASTAEGFLGKTDPERLRGKFEPASIGPVTTAALSELGYAVSIEAEPSTTAGLVAAISRFFETPASR